MQTTQSRQAPPAPRPPSIVAVAAAAAAAAQQPSGASNMEMQHLLELVNGCPRQPMSEASNNEMQHPLQPTNGASNNEAQGLSPLGGIFDSASTWVAQSLPTAANGTEDNGNDNSEDSFTISSVLSSGADFSC